MVVTIYYNDVNTSEKPIKVFPNCPSINIDVENAKEFADNKVEKGEWFRYVIPDLSDEEVLFLNKLPKDDD